MKAELHLEPTRWSYHADLAAPPSWLRRQSMRHSDELSPWIIAIAWMSALGIGGMSVFGVVVGIQRLVHWLF